MIVCNSCGLIDDYDIRPKGVHKMAYCKGCGQYIKNVAYSEHAFHFGKFKGRKLDEVEDIEYLRWVKDKVTSISTPFRNAIRERIYLLEDMNR